MHNLINMGVSQKVLSQICNLNQSTVSRYIANQKILPIDKTSKKHKYTLSDTQNILRQLYIKNSSVNKQILSFYNFKGGTGKTSLCFQVATHLSLCGFKVLAVDADPQGHLSTMLGFNGMDNFLTLYDLVSEDIPINQVISKIHDNLHCIPSNLSLTKIMISLDQMPKREEIIKNLFKKIENDYDYIIFDTNPTISTLNRNIIVYSSIINIVCETQPLSINGLKILFDDLYKFFHLMQMPFPNIFIIPNKYEDKSSSSAESMAALIKYYPQHLKTDFAIRRSEDINNAAKLGLPVAGFVRNNSNALEDIIELVRETIYRTTSQ